jgi:hypothetical protein
MNYVLLLVALLTFSSSYGQSDSITTTTLGFELDALPYITGGYYASIWVGHKHFRYRAVVTKASTPDFFLEDGFTNNDLMVYAVIADYFFKPNFEKWWLGIGMEVWDEKIQTDAKMQTTAFTNTIATLGAGYVWKFYRNFYLNPWAAGHVRVGGNKNVKVDNKTFKPTLFTPEASLKLGWHF